MKLVIREGYEFVQDIKGDGIVNILARRKDGTEDDVEVAQIIDGKFIIPGGSRELGKAAQLVYQVVVPTEEKFGIYASESGVPTDEDFDVISETELSNFIIIEGLTSEDREPETIEE